jgi:hypothetical protein
MINFITFGAGGQNYYDAVDRLKTQANNLNLFNNIYCYTDYDLKTDSTFWNKHSDFIINNKRGYGYWLWKPYLIKKTMEKMNDGDILLYLDSGCEIDVNKKEKLIKYFDLVKYELIIGTLTRFMEKFLTKIDLFVELNMVEDQYLNTIQHQAGVLLFLVCDKTRNIVNEWYELGCTYHNINDNPSINKTLVCYKEHRHDQSIFSLLTKKYKLFSKESLHNCIEIIRNRSGKYNY